MILFTVGTHEAPFDRLVRVAAEIAAAGEEPVVIQAGYATEPAPRAEVHAILAPAELAARVAEARVVVTHAGPATILQVLAAGKVPIVVPRDPAYAEHVDGHQLAFARHLVGRVHVVFDPEDLPEAIRRHDAVCAGLSGALWRPDPGAMADEVDALARALNAIQGHREGVVRASLSRILSRLGWSR